MLGGGIQEARVGILFVKRCDFGLPFKKLFHSIFLKRLELLKR